MSGIIFIAVIQLVVGILAFTTVSALIGMPVMKLSAPAVRWKTHGAIAWWAFLRGHLLTFGIYAIYILGLGRHYSQVPSWAVLVSLIASAWLISIDLKKHGISKRFPGVGARVVVALIAASWLLVGLVALVGSFG